MNHRRKLALAVVLCLGLVLTVLAINSADDVVAWAAGAITVGSLAAWR
jgi:hypothetical protein